MTIHFYTPEEIRQDVNAFEGCITIKKAKEPFGPRVFFKNYSEYWQTPIDVDDYETTEEWLKLLHKRSYKHVITCSLPSFERKHNSQSLVSVYTLKLVIPFIPPWKTFIPDGHLLQFCTDFYLWERYKEFIETYDGDSISLIHEHNSIELNIRTP